MHLDELRSHVLNHLPSSERVKIKVWPRPTRGQLDRAAAYAMDGPDHRGTEEILAMIQRRPEPWQGIVVTSQRTYLRAADIRLSIPHHALEAVSVTGRGPFSKLQLTVDGTTHTAWLDCPRDYLPYWDAMVRWSAPPPESPLGLLPAPDVRCSRLRDIVAARVAEGTMSSAHADTLLSHIDVLHRTLGWGRCAADGRWVSALTPEVLIDLLVTPLGVPTRVDDTTWTIKVHPPDLKKMLLNVVADNLSHGLVDFSSNAPPIQSGRAVLEPVDGGTRVHMTGKRMGVETILQKDFAAWFVDVFEALPDAEHACLLGLTLFDDPKPPSDEQVDAACARLGVVLAEPVAPVEPPQPKPTQSKPTQPKPPAVPKVQPPPTPAQRQANRRRGRARLAGTALIVSAPLTMCVGWTASEALWVGAATWLLPDLPTALFALPSFMLWALAPLELVVGALALAMGERMKWPMLGVALLQLFSVVLADPCTLVFGVAVLVLSWPLFRAPAGVDASEQPVGPAN